MLSRRSTVAYGHRPTRVERFGERRYELPAEELPPAYVKKGDHVDISRQPSFRKFKIP